MFGFKIELNIDYQVFKIEVNFVDCVFGKALNTKRRFFL